MLDNYILRMVLVSVFIAFLFGFCAVIEYKNFVKQFPKRKVNSIIKEE